MERTIRLLLALAAAGSTGCTRDELAAVAGWANAADPGSQLTREFRELRKVGWDIKARDDLTDQSQATYVLTAHDNRLRLKLTDRQQAELRRAAILANQAEVADRLGLPPTDRPETATLLGQAASRSDALDTILLAMRIGAELRFRYKGSDRVVHPGQLRTQSTKWYLIAREGEMIKNYVVSRMTDVSAGPAGSAEPVPHSQLALHPLHWAIDEPLEVTLRTPREFELDVERWLLRPESRREVGEDVEMTYTSTHHAAFRSRIYQLATRVEVLGSPQFRAQMLAELSAMAGE